MIYVAKPRVFISHCETNFTPTDFAIRIIDLMGCTPVIAEREPKLSRTVPSLVHDSMDSCDAVIVIATPDRDSPSGKECSQGVLVEIGQLQKSEKFKGRFVIIKEQSVVFGPMIPEARYKFNGSDLSPIAEAVLIELGSMSLFKNYYEMPGSDMEMHKLIEVINQLKDLANKGVLPIEKIGGIIEEQIRKKVSEITKVVS